MYPAGSVSLSKSTYPVRPGDTMKAEVARTGSSYTLSLTSTGTDKWTFSTAVSGTDANTSAEWVVEAPQVCFWIFCRQASLTNFGTMSFTGSQAGTGAGDLPISSFTTNGGPHEITMVTSSGVVKAQPTPLQGGAGFSDVWKHS